MAVIKPKARRPLAGDSKSTMVASNLDNQATKYEFVDPNEASKPGQLENRLDNMAFGIDFQQQKQQQPPELNTTAKEASMKSRFNLLARQP